MSDTTIAYITYL